MGLNQTIQTPLTLFSGSISAHTVAAGSTQGQLMTIISSSIPAYQAAFWNYKIKTETTYVTASAQTAVSELIVNMTSAGYYLIIGYYGIGCSSTTTGVRLGNLQTSLNDSSVVTEVPDTLTSVLDNWEGTTGPTATTFPSNNVNNFYLAKHLFIGRPNTATATFTPSIAVSTAAAGVTASMGPSVIFWKKITPN